MQTRSSPSLVTLHSLARQASIPDFQRMPKTLLFKRLRQSFDLNRLQRAEARAQREKSLINNKRKRNTEEITAVAPLLKKRRSARKVQLNTLDPIMFTPIGKKNTWKFVRPNGSTIIFNVESLIEYMIATGDFSDPETRIPFSDEDLKEIDDAAVCGGLSKPSVFSAKHNSHAYNDFKFRRDAILGLDRCAGEVITDILRIIETCDPDEAQMRLMMRELPIFQDYFSQLRDADSSYAKQSMSHWLAFLRGPPNRPNEDFYGLIEMCEPSLSTTQIHGAAHNHHGGYGHHAQQGLHLSRSHPVASAAATVVHAFGSGAPSTSHGHGGSAGLHARSTSAALHRRAGNSSHEMVFTYHEDDDEDDEDTENFISYAPHSHREIRAQSLSAAVRAATAGSAFSSARTHAIERYSAQGLVVDPSLSSSSSSSSLQPSTYTQQLLSVEDVPSAVATSSSSSYMANATSMGSASSVSTQSFETPALTGSAASGLRASSRLHATAVAEPSTSLTSSAAPSNRRRRR